MIPLIERRVSTTNAGTAITIALDAVKPGRMQIIRDYSLFNESGESVTVKPGFITLGAFIAFDQSYTVADGAAFGSYYVDKRLREGDRFAMQVTGSANKAKVTMIVSGDDVDMDCYTLLISPAANPPKPAAGG